MESFFFTFHSWDGVWIYLGIFVVGTSISHVLIYMSKLLCLEKNHAEILYAFIL